jgi:FkbM family methyltransferase
MRPLLLTKQIGQQFITWLGYDVRSRRSLLRPAGDMASILEQLRDRGFQPKAILDVGANKGAWSRTAKSVFKAANCYLIEPQIEMQSYLEPFCKEFPNSEWILAGAGAESGELTLTVWDDLAGSSFLPSTDDAAQVSKQRTVPIVTIDELIAEKKMPIPELVKLDVQGFELEALKGATQLFGKTEVFIMEVSLFPFLPGQPIFDEVIGFMRDRNYVVYDFPGFSRRPLDRALGQCDVCFVKKESFLRTSHAWD